jgi:hypothetical protein
MRATTGSTLAITSANVPNRRSVRIGPTPSRCRHALVHVSGPDSRPGVWQSSSDYVLTPNESRLSGGRLPASHTTPALLQLHSPAKQPSSRKRPPAAGAG